MRPGGRARSPASAKPQGLGPAPDSPRPNCGPRQGPARRTRASRHRGRASQPAACVDPAPRLTTSPLPARRTGLANCPHPAPIRDHALRPRTTRVGPPTGCDALHPRPSGQRTSARPRPDGSGTPGSASRPGLCGPADPAPSQPSGPRLPSLPHAAPSKVPEPVPELAVSRQSPSVLSPFAPARWTRSSNRLSKRLPRCVSYGPALDSRESG